MLKKSTSMSKKSPKKREIVAWAVIDWCGCPKLDVNVLEIYPTEKIAKANKEKVKKVVIKIIN